MGNTEIKYIDFELKNQKGNLNNLFLEWSAIPKVDTHPLDKSKGDTAKQGNNNCTISETINGDMLKLLSNSVGFFEAAGVSFTESDEKCANSIKEEGQKYYKNNNSSSKKEK